MRGISEELLTSNKPREQEQADEKTEKTSEFAHILLVHTLDDVEHEQEAQHRSFDNEPNWKLPVNRAVVLED